MRLLTVLPLMLLPLVTLYSAEEFTGSFDLVASQKYPSGSERSDTTSYHFGTDKTAIIIPSRAAIPNSAWYSIRTK
ncbi:hypothetical protein [Pelagicoccus sp. SDUM812002]|uniref:hypothetical protein n=1 Tax=Pelagicoccus sp. SDUM812002 TaxID=3041266 RepID=UPI00280F78AF|nr:hypothetical protein [Pelagicoccus sp. SDUM812002]MDQ8185712.1 hypothetical protein [Pelagicoccus sp. SDUM812002]